MQMQASAPAPGLFCHKGTRAQRTRGPSCLCVFVALFLCCTSLTETLHAQETSAQLVTRGNQLLAEGDEGEAEKAYRQALREDDALLPAYAGLARVAMEQEDWKEASGWADEILRRDPESLEGHYLHGIAERERAKFRTLLQRQHWKGAEEDFEAILARDSLYQDALYQFARLRRYGEAYREAVQLGEAQVRLKPELAEAQRGLFRFYDYFVRHTPTSEALAWLEKQNSGYARYAAGEALRRDGRLDDADAELVALLEEETAVPPQPVLLARARVAYAQGYPKKAQAFVEEAIERIDSESGAALVFEDAKYVVSGEELAQYRALETPEAYRAFFRAFWTKRDPTPARAVNVRLAEHYKRLLRAEKDYAYDGFRHWHVDPDQLSELRLPETHELGDLFNDEGLIYLRHGEPDDRVVTVGGPETPPTLSWRYYAPAMDFHFLTAGPNNDWRLTPRLPVTEDVVEDREQWGGIYAHMASTMRRSGLPGRTSNSALEWEGFKNELIDSLRQDAALAFTTDRHTWEDDIEDLEMPYLLAAFRGEDGETELEIHYAIPLGVATEAAGADVRRLTLEAGYALHDTTWQPVKREVETKRVPASSDRTSALMDLFRLRVPPGLYHVALHGHPEGTDLLGGDTLTYRVPNYAASSFALSDVLLAYHIEPSADSSRFNRYGLNISSNPLQRYPRGQPVALYFEIYGLSADGKGQAHYQLDYGLNPEKPGRTFLGLFGRGDRPALTLRTERESGETDPVEHAEIDVGNVDPGRYTLTVRVTDLRSGAVQERSRTLELME